MNLYRIEVDGSTVRFHFNEEDAVEFEATVDDARRFKAERDSSDETDLMSGMFSQDGKRLVGKKSWGSKTTASYGAYEMVMYLYDGSETCPDHP